MTIINDLKKLVPGLKENISLKDYTTFKIGGPARFFYTAKTEQELIKAVRAARQTNIRFFILGGGSNLLVSDNGFNGLVIKLEIKGLGLQEGGFIVEAGAGEMLWDLVDFTAKHGLKGMEWAAGIPGTLGGALQGNAAAFGSAMNNVAQSARALNCSSFKIEEFLKEKCAFANKESVFKENKGLAIVSLKIILEKGDKKEIGQKIKECKKYRADNHPISFPSAGCVFKNYELGIMNQELPGKFQELRKLIGKDVIPAGYLIDKCGLKGETKGGAEISEKHANFIINTGNARAEDVVWLIKLAKRKVKEKFSVELEEEIQYLGHFDY